MRRPGSTATRHLGPFGRGLGEHVYITFDPDGTVGEIQWLKLDGKPFSESEIQQRPKGASNITWERTAIAGHGELGWLDWIGSQNGKVIFDANEGDNGRGTWFLTITTR